MPIYEYQCSKCSHRFEIIHGAEEKGAKAICPKCGNKKSERLVSSFSCGGTKGDPGGAVSGCGPGPRRFS